MRTRTIVPRPPPTATPPAPMPRRSSMLSLRLPICHRISHLFPKNQANARYLSAEGITRAQYCRLTLGSSAPFDSAARPDQQPARRSETTTISVGPEGLDPAQCVDGCPRRGVEGELPALVEGAGGSSVA